MLEFETSYFPFESLFKSFASDMTIYSTSSLPQCRVISWNSISALNSWTQNCLFLCFRRRPEQTRVQKYIYGSFDNFNPQAIVKASCRKNNALQNSVLYQTALCTYNYWRRNITEPVREYFAHFRYQPSHFVHSLFINAYWWRNLLCNRFQLPLPVICGIISKMEYAFCSGIFQKIPEQSLAMIWA